MPAAGVVIVFRGDGVFKAGVFGNNARQIRIDADPVTGVGRDKRMQICGANPTR